jgi:putative oxygen-independent coproporphyrinogen III oxidase
MHGPAAASPLALYLHWPFCAAKCPYCDFNSHVRERLDEPRFRAALLAELAWEAGRLGPRRLTSIFFGGGTPSLMHPDTVAALIEAATAHFTPQADLEVTLEANPSSVEVGRLAGYRAAGVNRISLGVQALDDAVLRFLGRRHDARQALAALEAARAIFPRASFDMIYARPGQSAAAWRAEFGRALALGFDHLALYQLTIEPGTAFATAHARGDFALPDADQAALLYDATADEAARFGLAAYEISNYARPGAESRHNLAYWRYQEYAGIGPGAHGRVQPRQGAAGGAALLATRRHRAPEAWAALVERHGHGTAEETPIAPADRAREALLMGLRLSEGIDAAGFAARTGIALADALDAPTLEAAIEEGYVTWNGRRLAATQAGRLRLDALLPRLVR